MVEPSGALTRLAGWRRAFAAEVVGIADLEGGVDGCSIVICEAWILVELLRASEPLLRLRVEVKVMLLSVEAEAVCKAGGSSSDVPLTNSSCVVAGGPVVELSLVNWRSSRI